MALWLVEPRGNFTRHSAIGDGVVVSADSADAAIATAIDSAVARGVNTAGSKLSLRNAYVVNLSELPSGQVVLRYFKHPSVSIL
jgi:hypothetical protein